MAYRPPPTPEECIEALAVMIEAYGYRRVIEMLADARTSLREDG